jgi:hypothetical protein
VLGARRLADERHRLGAIAPGVESVVEVLGLLGVTVADIGAIAAGAGRSLPAGLAGCLQGG